MNSYSIDFSANQIVNTISNASITNAKGEQADEFIWSQTDVEGRPDCSTTFHIPENESIVITSDAVFIKPLKLVVLTEDVYNKLKEKENERI